MLQSKRTFIVEWGFLWECFLNQWKTDFSQSTISDPTESFFEKALLSSRTFRTPNALSVVFVFNQCWSHQMLDIKDSRSWSLLQVVKSNCCKGGIPPGLLQSLWMRQGREFYISYRSINARFLGEATSRNYPAANHSRPTVFFLKPPNLSKTYRDKQIL